MKKICSLLMAFVLLLVMGTAAAAAEAFTISEVRQQAEAGWRQTYEAYGRTIVVDVDAIVPDVTAVPISKCKYSEHHPAIADGSGIKLEYSITDILGISSTMLADGVTVQTVDGNLGTPVTITTYYPPIELDRTYFSGYSLTLRDLTMRFKEMLALIGIDPDKMVADNPYMLTINEYYDKSKGEQVIPSYGWANFYQLMNGVPILLGWSEAYDEQPLYGATASLGFILSHESFFVGVMTMEEIEQLAADVPLCSFLEVIAAFEEEIQNGHIRKLYDLNFGYALCSAPENGGPKKDIDPNNRFYAVPVWVANCMYVPSAKKELRTYDESYGTDERNALEYQKIMVNAQTGELIDPMDQGKNRGYYNGYVSWDDVGAKP